MKRKEIASLEQLSAVIAAIHDAALDDACWSVALEQMGSLFHSNNVTVWMQDSAGGFQDVRALDQVEEATRDYATYYGRLDPLRPAVMRAPVGVTLTDEMVTPRSEFVRTEFYNDFAARHDMHGCIQARTFESQGYSGHVGIARNHVRPFEAEDVRLLRLLLPHLHGTQRTRRHLAHAAAERANVLAALDGLSQGVLILDPQDRVLHANPAAEALLRLDDGLATARGRLHAKRSADAAALRHALATAKDGGSTLAIERPSGRSSFIVSVQPAGGRLGEDEKWGAAPMPVTVVFVVEPDGPADGAAIINKLRALYGLTPTEAAVGSAVGQGQGVKEAAEALRIAPSTVRWHLQTVFDKTRTCRQAELARLTERLNSVSA